MARFFSKQNPFVKTITGVLQRVATSLVSFTSEDVKSGDATLTGLPFESRQDQLLKTALDIFAVSNTDYLKSVRDCKELTEYNPVFYAILRKAVNPVAREKSTVKVNSILGNDKDSRIELIEKDLNEMVARTFWNKSKAYLLRNMLNEGGISVEVILDRDFLIQGLEYRPHYSIRPLWDANYQFPDPSMAYQQVDINSTEVMATFAKWQIIDVNFEESSFHDRGIPFLQAARKTLEAIGDMINGMVQKWIRSGGELEAFVLGGSTSWEDVQRFKEENAQALQPTTESLIRQIYAKGDMTIQRIHGDRLDGDTAAVEFLLEIVFMAVGISKEIMGFKGHVVIKDMAELSNDGYVDLLETVQDKNDTVLRQACELQLLCLNQKYKLLPEHVNFDILGKDFKKESRDKKVDRVGKVIEVLLKVMSDMGFDTPGKVAMLAKIANILDKELSEYEVEFTDLKDIELKEPEVPGAAIEQQPARQQG